MISSPHKTWGCDGGWDGAFDHVIQAGGLTLKNLYSYVDSNYGKCDEIQRNNTTTSTNLESVVPMEQSIGSLFLAENPSDAEQDPSTLPSYVRAALSNYGGAVSHVAQVMGQDKATCMIRNLWSADWGWLGYTMRGIVSALRQ